MVQVLLIRASVKTSAGRCVGASMKIREPQIFRRFWKRRRTFQRLSGLQPRWAHRFGENMRDSSSIRRADRHCGQSIDMLCGRFPPAVRPTRFFERCGQNKPSEVSFDSRRGATLETFSSRNEHSGLGAGDEASCRGEKASSDRTKPLCGLALTQTIVSALGIAPAAEK